MPLLTLRHWSPISCVTSLWWVTDQVWISFRLNGFGLIKHLELLALAKYLVVTTLVHYALRYWLDFWYLELQYELQIKFSFCSHWIILAKLLSLDFRILRSIQIVLQNHCMPRLQTYHKCSSRGPETLLCRFEAIRNQRCLPWPLTGRNILSFFSRTTACEDTRLADSLSSTGLQDALILLRVFRYPTWPPRLLIGRWDILTSPP